MAKAKKGKCFTSQNWDQVLTSKNLSPSGSQPPGPMAWVTSYLVGQVPQHQTSRWYIY